MALRPAAARAAAFPAGAVVVGGSRYRYRSRSRSRYGSRYRSRSRSRSWWRELRLPIAVPALYLALSIVWIGRFALEAPGRGTIGAGPDVQIFLWALRWWPYAFQHGLDPLISHAVWPPYGANLLWTTTVPLLSALAAPVTLAFGPGMAWNLLCVLAPALSASAAYALCLELTEDRRASVVGGLLFGFSSYEVAEGIAHLQLTMAALVPLSALVVVRYLRGRYTGPGLAWRMGTIAAAEFLISPEVLTSLLLLALLAAAAGAVLLVELRPRLLSGLGWSAAGLLGAALLCAPELVPMLQTMTAAPRNPPASYSTDLLNLVVPTRVTAISGPWSAPIAARFTGNLSEQTGYLGVPLLLILVVFLRAHRRDRRVRLLALVTAAALVLSLGPELRIGGQAVGWMPYSLLSGLPGLRDALPARFALYVALGAAVAVALWLSPMSSRSRRAPRGGGRRWLAVTIAIACLLPASSSQLFWRAAPSWIVHDDLARIIPAGDTVVWLPFWSLGDRGLYAQAVADFRFRLDDRWLQVIPASYRTAANSSALAAFHSPAGARRGLGRSLCALHADYAVVPEATSPSADPLAGAHLRPIHADGLLVYALPGARCGSADRRGRAVGAGRQ